MAALDLIFVGVLLVSMLIGAWRGLVFELLSALSWAAAFVLAQWFAADLAALLPLSGWPSAGRYAAGFAVVFVLALFGCGMVAALARKLVEATGLRPADRALGALFGVVRAGVLLLVMAVLAQLTPLHESDWWHESSGAPWLSVALKELKPALPEEFGKYLPS
ncbi:CvpA family protein [Simplicispira psychrophila]|uniref:CvpA family protein n=1 Tax=Simplicispira psychrophila TaxID=80882 RepID=UPI000487CF3D|nr:CvpA family protein [Simplicispira psychrophila]